MLNISIDESLRDEEFEQALDIVDEMKKKGKTGEIKIGLKLVGRMDTISIVEDFTKSIEDDFDRSKVSRKMRREEIFKALEDINDANFDTPAGFWKERYGDFDLDKGFDRICFKENFLDSSDRNVNFSHNQFYASDYLLAKTCQDPRFSEGILKCMNRKAMEILSNEIGYEVDNGVSVDVQVANDVRRLDNIFLSKSYEERISLLNEYAKSFDMHVHSDFVDKRLVGSNNLEHTIDVFEEKENLLSVSRISGYAACKNSFFKSFENDSTLKHPAFDLNNGKEVDGKVVMKPALVCDTFGRPFQGFSQLFMQREVFGNPMCQPDKFGQVYLFAKELLPPKTVLGSGLECKLPVLRSGKDKDGKQILYSETREFIPRSCIKGEYMPALSKEAYYKERIGDSLKAGQKISFGYISASKGKIVPLIDGKKLVVDKEVVSYLENYLAAARAGVPFVTTRDTQKRIREYLANPYVAKGMVQNFQGIAKEIDGNARGLVNDKKKELKKNLYIASNRKVKSGIEM